jgi:hypothetical protein
MKKLFLPLGVIALSLFFACSSESDAIDTNQNAASTETTVTKHAARLANLDVATARQMYLDMIVSSDYLSYKTAHDAFVAKLKIPIGDFSTKAKAMLWINNHLSQTLFASTTEFEQMFDAANNKFVVVLQNNDDFFTLIKDAELDQIGEIFKQSHTMPVTTTGCEDDCADAVELAYVDSDALAEEQILTLIQTGDPESDYYNYATQWNQIQIDQDQREAQIGLDYNDCVGNC